MSDSLKRTLPAFFFLLSICLNQVSNGQEANWGHWRGPTGNSIAENAGKFIMQNPNQFEKNIKAHEIVEEPKVFLHDSYIDKENYNATDIRVLQIVKEISDDKKWFFERSVYKSKLESNLPVDDFFTWCEKSLKEEKDDFNFDNYFMITSLMFDEDFNIKILQEKITIKTKQGELIMPKLKIEKKEYDLSK